jgi:hypothetical protein
MAQATVVISMSLNLSQFIGAETSDSHENLPTHVSGDFATAGGSHRCRFSPPYTTCSIPSPAKPGYDVGSKTDAVTVGPRSGCCRRLSPSASASVRSFVPFPVPATSHAACRFPARHAPARFASRVMRPIALGALSTVAAWVARYR